MTADAEPGSGEQPEAPLVSVIIPTWNRAPMLRLALATVLAQDLAGDFEVLVIGDACTDESEAVVASFADPRLHWHNLAQNSGSASVPTNAGLRMARGRYIAHLGHDDFWFPWHLSGLVAVIEQTGADWVYSLVVAIGPEGIRHCTGPPQAGVPQAEHHVPPSGWLYRREVFIDIGGWREPHTIPWQIDFDVMRRAALAGKRFACHARPTALKFPSSMFPDGYRLGGPAAIQRDYFARLTTDPRHLEQDLLLGLAIRFAQVDRGGGKGIFARQPPRNMDVGASLWSARRWLMSRYGAERWPMPQLLHGQFQGRRLGRFHLRGLTPNPVAGTSPGDTTGDNTAIGIATINAGDVPEVVSPASVEQRLAMRDVRRELRRRRRHRDEERLARQRARQQSAQEEAASQG
jgi:hypothetical protein